MSTSDVEELIRRIAAANALKYGKAKVNPVLAKIFSERPELRPKAREIKQIVERIVQEINSLGQEELQSLAGDLAKRKKKERERRWPVLPNADKYDVIVTRVAPEPNGYPTLGHVKGLLVPFVYARLYGGRFLLRFEDTNPRVEKLEFYEAIREEFARVLEAAERELNLSPGKWDEEIIESNHLPKMYELAEKLIVQGDAYVCTCDAATVRKSRNSGVECEHRSHTVERNLELWKQMLNGELHEGEAHLRLKTDMKHPNRTMRDPGIFRIVEAEHPIHGNKYRVYPTYDFSISVMDSLTGVTHAFRSKEFEPHVEVQRTIIRKLGLREYDMIQFGRITVEGIPLSKRYIRPLIKTGILEGWDDPRIPTLRGLFRRGITPEALARFFFELGPSKVDSTVSFDALAAVNRKILDPKVPRYMFAPDPMKLKIEGFPEKIVAEVRVHPDRPEMGSRRIEVRSSDGRAEVYISGDDFRRLTRGDVIRLRNLATVEIKSVMSDEVSAVFKSREPTPDSKMIVQWVPKEDPTPVKVMKPLSPFSMAIIGGFGEPKMRDLREGEHIHLVRFGFARVDSVGDTVRLIFSHG